MSSELKAFYKNVANQYWNQEYENLGYKVVHDAGTEEKTMKLAEREIDLFLWPTQEKCLSLLNDKENNPWPTFWEDFAQKHSSIDHYLHDLKNKIALDYGCGILGRYSIALSKFFKKVYGVDVSDLAVVGARNKAKEVSANNITFIQNNGLNIPVAAKSIDFIFSNLVLQHIGYKDGHKEIIKEFGRILTSTGCGRIEYIDSTQNRPDDFFSVVEGFGIPLEELKEIYKENGLKIVEASDKFPYLWITFMKE